MTVLLKAYWSMGMNVGEDCESEVVRCFSNREKLDIYLESINADLNVPTYSYPDDEENDYRSDKEWYYIQEIEDDITE